MKGLDFLWVTLIGLGTAALVVALDNHVGLPLISVKAI